MSDFLDELTGQSMGGIQTDHGGITIGDILVLLLDLVLLVYTAFRSYDFLTTTVPDGWQTLALIGLWGLDIGAVFWSLTWIFGSTGKFQNWVSLSLFVIDLAGVGLTGLTDSLMYGKETVMSETLGGVTTMAVPVVVFLNVVAGFIFHMTSPQTKNRRKQRELEAEHVERMNQVREAQMKLTFTQAQLLARQETVELAEVMAQIKVTQDQIEQNARKRLRDNRMAGVRGSLERLTGDDPTPLYNGGDNDAQLNALRTSLDELNGKLRGKLPRADGQKTGSGLNLLSGLNALKQRFSGGKESDEQPEENLDDMQSSLQAQIEEAQRTLAMLENLKAQTEEPIVPIENHPQAGNNGGHALNPT